MRHIRPIELFELAEQMWESHQEGHHLIFDLATAGFSSVNCISSLGESKKDPDTSYRLKGTTLGGRPAIKGCWPGRKYYPVKQ